MNILFKIYDPHGQTLREKMGSSDKILILVIDSSKVIDENNFINFLEQEKINFEKVGDGVLIKDPAGIQIFSSLYAPASNDLLLLLPKNISHKQVKKLTKTALDSNLSNPFLEDLKQLREKNYQDTAEKILITDDTTILLADAFGKEIAEVKRG